MDKNDPKSAAPRRRRLYNEATASDISRIMQILFQHDYVSIAEIVKWVGWSRPKVSQRMQELRDRGLVEEISSEIFEKKKKTMIFRVDKKKFYLAGIEIEKASLRVSLANISGEVLEHRSRSISEYLQPEEALSLCTQLLSDVLATVHSDYPNPLLGIAVSVPGCVDFGRGRILHSFLLQPTWELFDIQSFFQSRFPETRVVVESDVNILALAERHLLSQSSIDNLLYISIGEDIRAGIICDGKIHRGIDGCAGHIGHICVDNDGPLCACGNTGCLNTFASEKAIVFKASSFSGPTNTSLTEKSKIHGTNLGLDEVFKASLEGDQVALETLQAAGNLLGEVIAGLITFLNPNHIAIGCHASSHDNRFLVSLKAAIYQQAFPPATTNITINFASVNRISENNATVLRIRGFLFGS